MSVGDVLALLIAIQRWTEQAAKAAALIQKMRDEGRDTLTAEELQSLQVDDDAARQELLDAISGAESPSEADLTEGP